MSSSIASSLSQHFKMPESAFKIETKYDYELERTVGRFDSLSGMLRCGAYGLTHLGEPSERDLTEMISDIGQCAKCETKFIHAR